ncbi:MAG: cyclic nucleotide-binding domain-containing protein [Anaerolineales bacterium]|jgi:CRP-like cAMP-binding protein
MISTELIRRYPFFAGFDRDQISTLASCAQEQSFIPGDYIFYEGDELKHFYLVLDGKADIVIGIPDRAKKHSLSGQLTRAIETIDITISTVQPGDIFGWSGLVPPHRSTASVVAATNCQVVSFDCEKLLHIFQEDNCFGYLMTQKIARVVRRRLRDMRIESLASTLV